MPVRGPHFLREVADSGGLPPVVLEISSANQNTAPCARRWVGASSPQAPAPHPIFALQSSPSPGGPCILMSGLLGFLSPGSSWGLLSVCEAVYAGTLRGVPMGVPPAVFPDCQSEEAKSLLPAGATPLCKSPLGSTAGSGCCTSSRLTLGTQVAPRLPRPFAAPPEFSAT